MGFVSQLFFGKAPFFCVRKFVVVLAVGKKRLLFLGHNQMRVAKLIGWVVPALSVFVLLVHFGSIGVPWFHLGSHGLTWVLLGMFGFP